MEKKTILLNNSVIALTDTMSDAPVIVFLHGFMESSEIWEDYVQALSPEHRVIAIDLPGHGGTRHFDDIYTMEGMADMVHEVLVHLRVDRCRLIGHSMGGYVALEFAARFPEMLLGLCLFHSNASEDSPEARINRTRAIELIRQDRIGFATRFIPELFAPDNREKYAHEIRILQERAAEMNAHSIMAAMEGMKQRKCHYNTLKALNVLVLFIIGQLDSRIDMTRMLEQILLAADTTVLLLRDCGHMGYIEARDECLRAIRGMA